MENDEVKPPQTGVYRKDGDAPSNLPSSPSGGDIRLRKIADFEKHALAEKQPLDANLALVNAGLMRTTAQMEQLISQSLSESNSLKEALQETQEGMDMYLRLVRQIERYSQLELKSRLLRQVEARPMPAPSFTHPNHPLLGTECGGESQSERREKN